MSRSTEDELLKLLPAEEQARLLAQGTAELAGEYNGLFLADERMAVELARSKDRTRAVGVLLRRKMQADGLARITVGQRRSWVRLTIHDDGGGFLRTRVDRPIPSGGSA